MRTEQLLKQFWVALVLAILLPLVLGGIIFQLLGDALQIRIEGLDQVEGLAWAVAFLTSGSGLLVFVLAFAGFLVAAMLPAFLSGRDDDGELDADDGRETGVVKWFNVSKGFGFITREEGDDIFVHFRSIRGRGHRSLRQGQKVRFSVREGDKGLQAEDVSAAR